MPIVIACTDCNIRMKVPDHVAGKAVRCVKCSKVIRVPAAKTKSGAAATARQLATNDPAPKPSPVENEPEQDEENAVEPPEAAPEEKKKTYASDWGKEFLEDLDVEDDMVKEIQKELARGERIVWAARPRQDILLAQAKATAVILGPIFVVAGMMLLVLGYLQVFGNDFTLSVMPMIMGGLLVLGSSAVFYRLIAVAKNVTRRPCYVLTNRRLLVHRGLGFHMFVGRGASRRRKAAPCLRRTTWLSINPRSYSTWLPFRTRSTRASASCACPVPTRATRSAAPCKPWPMSAAWKSGCASSSCILTSTR